MKMLCPYAGAVALICLLPFPALTAGQRAFKEQGFSVHIPDDYEELPADQVPEGMIAVYVKGDRTDANPDSVISVQSLGGLIGRDSHLKMSDMPKELAAQGFTLGKMMWNGHVIDTIEGKVSPSGVAMISVGAQLPLTPSAVQLNFASPAAEEAALRATAKTVVDSVIGTSNWDAPAVVMKKLSSEERITRFTQGIFQLAGFCLVVILIVRGARKKKVAIPKFP